MSPFFIQTFGKSVHTFLEPVERTAEHESLQNDYSDLVEMLKNLDLFPMLYDVILEKCSQVDIHKFYQLHKAYSAARHIDGDIDLRNTLGPENYEKFYMRMMEQEEPNVVRLKTWCSPIVGYMARMKAWCCCSHSAEEEEEGERCAAMLKAGFNGMVERKGLIASK